MTRILIAIIAFVLNFYALGAVNFKKVADGAKDATPTIQKAIDDCAAQGGGQVVIPAGNYLCGPILLKSNVDLHLCRGARIMGRTDYRTGYNLECLAPEDEDRKDTWNNYSEKALILGKNVENVSITGHGIIDGQSNLIDFDANGYKNNDGRPYGVLFKESRNITVRDVTICNAAFWTMRLWFCEKVIIDGVRINSLYFKNNDGIDIDARDVTISNCIIEAEDDGICLKSDSKTFKPGNITITNCVVSSNCNPIKFGTASKSGWDNVTISNCVIKPSPYCKFRTFHGWYRNVAEGFCGGMAGIAIECADGGDIRNVTISNIAMSGIITPIFIVLNRRQGVGRINGINISNITASAEGVIPCMIAGLPECKIENVSLTNINVVQRGGEKEVVKTIPEAPTKYPENRMFGMKNPACGLYLRHVDGIYVDNFKVRLLEEDRRPCVVMDDVTGEHLSDISCQGTCGPLTFRR